MRRAFMSEEKENMLNLFEEFKTTLVDLIDDRDKLASEIEELRTARREADEKAWAANEKNQKLESDLEAAVTKGDKADSKVSSLKEQVKDLKSQLAEAEASGTDAVDAIVKERDELRAEMDEITSKLSRVSELYRETSAEKEALQEKVDVSDLLGIYIVLLETVFYGKPHARILYTLHDIKKPITRKNLADSSGIMPAQVLKAIHDLANENLVSYNEDNQLVALKKEIM
jgi:DNA repair exonuclease SbcCD ATPase subunit